MTPLLWPSSRTTSCLLSNRVSRTILPSKQAMCLQSVECWVFCQPSHHRWLSLIPCCSHRWTSKLACLMTNSKEASAWALETWEDLEWGLVSSHHRCMFHLAKITSSLRCTMTHINHSQPMDVCHQPI